MMNLKSMKVGEKVVVASGALAREASNGIKWIRDFNRELDSAESVLEDSEIQELDRLLNKLDHILVKVEKLG